MKNIKHFAVTIIAAGILLSGCKKQEAQTSVPEQPNKVQAHAVKPKDAAPETFLVKFETTQGDFTVKVTRDWAPLGADRFYALNKENFYDGGAFFRVVPNFVVQFGINPNPSVSAKWKHTEFQDDAVKQSNKRGMLTFATSGANTRTTQLFINLKDNTKLDTMGFSPFGVVMGDGMNIVDKLYSAYGEAGPNQDEIEKQGNAYVKKGWPKLDYIKKVSILP